LDVGDVSQQMVIAVVEVVAVVVYTEVVAQLTRMMQRAAQPGSSSVGEFLPP